MSAVAVVAMFLLYLVVFSHCSFKSAEGRNHRTGKREDVYNGTKPTYPPDYDLPQIKTIQSQYENSKMIVTIEFDRPFNGIIFSERNPATSMCSHLAPGSGLSKVTFDIDVKTCGTTSSDNFNHGGYGYSGTFIENAIKIQYDSLVQNNWDQSATFQVDMLPLLAVDNYGDNMVRCWMQIEVCKGPLASERSGLVKIGQTMTMVL